MPHAYQAVQHDCCATTQLWSAEEKCVSPNGSSNQGLFPLETRRGSILNVVDRIWAVLLTCHKPATHSMEGENVLQTVEAGAPGIVKKGFPNDHDCREGVI